MPKLLDTPIVERVMDRALDLNEECALECRDFKIMESSLLTDTLILRYTTIDISDEDRPVQCFHYECFDKNGYPTPCRVNFKNPREANDFFWSLQPLYQQQFACDHKLKR